ncbi:cupin domain-containing protein [Microbacterium sp. K24]|uniref:cupin domain-containing protein n=1 Tax=Microbacterium sp. K24 TaxID=2305446 RepID=UPI001F0F718B|nr:cupin domain-containing protein [Microbacterium sp. K24]
MRQLVPGRDPESHGLDVIQTQLELDAVIRVDETLDRSSISSHIETLGRLSEAVETGAMNSTEMLPEGIVAAADIRIGTGRSRRFVGAEHGAGVSYFYVENLPGEGPGMHWHPYPETWVILEGTAQIVIGDEVFLARAGDTATGPAFTPHCFTNVGDGKLKIIGIHASATIIQTFLDED